MIKTNKHIIVFAILICFLPLAACGINKADSNTDSSKFSKYDLLNESENISYKVENGTVDNDSFHFIIPDNYQVNSTINNISVKDEVKGITITIEENNESTFNVDSYIESLKQQFSDFGVNVVEEEGVIISNSKARKVHITGLNNISENEGMYCYFIPLKTNEGHLIISASFKKDTLMDVKEVEKIIIEIAIK